MTVGTVVKYIGLGVIAVIIPGGIPLAAAWLYWKYKETVDNNSKRDDDEVEDVSSAD